MARLTWDNVATPNFSGIGDSYRVMSQLLGNATRSGMDMIDTVRNTNAEAADRAILQRMVGVQDPTAYDPNAIIGADGSRASLDTLRGVGDYAGTLLNRAVTGETLNQTRYNNQRTQTGNALMDAAAEPARQFAIATRNNDQATANSLLRTNPELANLRPDQLMGLITEGDTLANSHLARTRTGQLIDQSTHNFGRQQRGENITDQTAAFRARLARTASDPQHAEQLLWQYAQDNNLAPEVINNLLPGVGSAGGASVGGGVPAGSDPSRIMNYEARASGFNAVPDTVRNLGQASDFALQVNDANRARTGEAGSSAMGTYQIVGSTLRSYAPKVFGDNWREVDFTPQNQDRLAQAIFDDNKGSADALRKQWVSLSAAEAEQVRQMPWEQAREVIAQKESGANPGQLRQMLAQQLEVPDARTDIMRADTMANSGSLNQRLADLEGQPDQPISVLTKGLQESGYAGYSQGELANEIRAIAAEAKVTNAQAALIMQESLTERSWFMQSMRNTPWLGRNVAENTFDRSTMIDAARQYRNAGLTTVTQNRERALVDAQLGQLQEREQQIDAQIQNARQRFQATQAPEHLERIRQLQGQKALLRAASSTVAAEQASTQEWTSADLAAEARRAAELEARAAASSPEALAARRTAEQRRLDLWINGRANRL